MQQILKRIGLLICAFFVLLMAGWGVLAIYWSDIPGDGLRAGLAGGFGLTTMLAFLLLPNRKRTLIGFLCIFADVVVWWLTIPASNDRRWQRDLAVLPFAEVQGDFVTVHNIRNLKYRTETDFDARYYDKAFDLRELDAVDLIAVYWTGDAIAHVMISFGFQEKDFLGFSIEIRKEDGEEYSTLKGIFKQFELIINAKARAIGDDPEFSRKIREGLPAPRQ